MSLSVGRTNAGLWNREGMLDNPQKQDNVKQDSVNKKRKPVKEGLRFCIHVHF